MHIRNAPRTSLFVVIACLLLAASVHGCDPGGSSANRLNEVEPNDTEGQATYLAADDIFFKGECTMETRDFYVTVRTSAATYVSINWAGASTDIGVRLYDGAGAVDILGTPQASGDQFVAQAFTFEPLTGDVFFEVMCLASNSTLAYEGDWGSPPQ